MKKRHGHPRPFRDFVSEEMVAALLEKPSYDFHELFEVVHARLRARHAAASGREMLRLRLYEKLRVLVAQGLVRKEEKLYFPVRQHLEERRAEMQAAAARRQERHSVLHSE